MLRAGLFADVDAVVTMHPGDRNAASASSSPANVTGKFRSTGSPRTRRARRTGAARRSTAWRR
ncbi:MAG: hypothetical protein R2712_01985 [Vicinamibacterales bacterium]